MDLEIYLDMVNESSAKLAIIGAGMSGLACALELQKSGIKADLFEKGRSTGGRVSTRRIGEFHFDHGAQYISDVEEKFKPFIEEWIRQGILKQWKATLGELRGNDYVNTFKEPVYVGSPKMSSLTNYLKSKLISQRLFLDVKITSTQRRSDKWVLINDKGHEYGPYEFVVSTIPPPQAIDIFSEYESIVSFLKSVDVEPCWALLLGFARRLDLEYDGVFVNNSPIRWMARNSSKPDRPEHETWVIHASRQWSIENLEHSKDRISQLLLSEFEKITGLKGVAPEYIAAHRWRYALAQNALSERYMIDHKLNVGFGGDYFGKSKIDTAYLSGIGLAQCYLKEK